MSTKNTYTDGSELQQRLQKIEYDTLDGNTCLAEVYEINEKRTFLIIKFRLPSGRESYEKFDMPEVASDEYRIVRLLESYGYGLSTIDLFLGEKIKVVIGEEGAQILIPEKEQPFTERLSKMVPRKPIMYTVGIVALPLILHRIFPEFHPYEMDMADWYFFYPVFLLCWVFTVGLAWLIVLDWAIGWFL